MAAAVAMASRYICQLPYTRCILGLLVADGWLPVGYGVCIRIPNNPETTKKCLN